MDEVTVNWAQLVTAVAPKTGPSQQVQESCVSCVSSRVAASPRKAEGGRPLCHKCSVLYIYDRGPTLDRVDDTSKTGEIPETSEPTLSKMTPLG